MPAKGRLPFMAVLSMLSGAVLHVIAEEVERTVSGGGVV